LPRVDCILPQRSQYQVLHHFTQKVAEAFGRLGWEVRLLDAENCITLCMQDPPDLMVGFNGAPQVTDGLFLCDVIDVPHAAILVDPPCYYLGLLDSFHMEIYCDDAANIDWLGQLGYEKAQFLTQGVEPELSYDNHAPRDLDVIFFASFFDVESAKEEWRRSFSGELCDLMEEAVQATLLDESLTLSSAFESRLQTQPELAQGIDIVKLYYLMSYVQKGIARIQLLENIHAIPVHIWDRRWSDYFGDKNKNLIIHDAVDYQTSLEITQRAKVVLCNSIRSVRGCNERVLNALACGAVPFTNANPYFREHFKDERDLIMYTHQDAIEKKIDRCLKDEEYRQSIVKAGRALVMSKHTWDQRIQIIVQNHQNT